MLCSIAYLVMLKTQLDDKQVRNQNLINYGPNLYFFITLSAFITFLVFLAPVFKMTRHWAPLVWAVTGNFVVDFIPLMMVVMFMVTSLTYVN